MVRNPRPIKVRLGHCVCAAAVVAGVSVTVGAGTGESSFDDRALKRAQSPPLGLPAVPIPDNNPLTADKIALGRKLFFDRRLSFNNTMSCGMCHVPEQGFTNNELATPIGVEGRSLRRNAPTILNAAYAELLFHDGRETSLENQTLGPLLARDEMANPSIGLVIARIEGLPEYDGLFERAFGTGPSVERIGEAIASWERTMLAGNSPFDRWYYLGDETALTEIQKKGFVLFSGEAACIGCHPFGKEFALFTDGLFHDTGIGYVSENDADRKDAPVPVEIAPGVVVPVERGVVNSVGQSRPTDVGRFEVTLDPEDKWHFKTPTLRNVALTAPYMHDGSMRTLEDVVRFYDRGGIPHPGLDPLIRPLGLSDEAIAALVGFLESLTSSDMPALRADARSVAVGN
ncbi:MAG: methylamine utilization protein MauG [Candidatus Krumholzibacteria bacterium]|nr:methylamine utilization protein MauG [Candidatus Krumholzibacteria bacterium]